MGARCRESGPGSPAPLLPQAHLTFVNPGEARCPRAQGLPLVGCGGQSGQRCLGLAAWAGQCSCSWGNIRRRGDS